MPVYYDDRGIVYHTTGGYKAASLQPYVYDCSTGKSIPVELKEWEATFTVKDPIDCWGLFHHDIKKIIFNPPATIVYWYDGDKTVVKCRKDETFDWEKGLAMAISKHYLGCSFKKEFKEGHDAWGEWKEKSKEK